MILLWDNLQAALGIYYGARVTALSKIALLVVEHGYQCYKKLKVFDCSRLTGSFLLVADLFEKCCELVRQSRAEQQITSCISKFVAAVEQMKTEVLYVYNRLLTRNVKEAKNRQSNYTDAIEEAFNLLLSRDFWNSFFLADCGKDDYSQSRTQCQSALRRIVDTKFSSRQLDVGVSAPEDSGLLTGGRRCRKAGCRQTAISGPYCEGHSVQNCEQMVQSPDLYKYLIDPPHRAHLQSWFLQQDDHINVNRILLWYSLNNYKESSSPSLRKRSSCKIYCRFLKEGVRQQVRVHDRVELLVRDAFESKGYIPAELLLQVQGAVYISLERKFLGEYIQSIEFQEFCGRQEEMCKTPRYGKTFEWRLPGEISPQQQNQEYLRKQKMANEISVEESTFLYYDENKQCDRQSGEFMDISQPEDASFSSFRKSDDQVYCTSRNEMPEKSRGRTYLTTSNLTLVPTLRLSKFVPRSADGRDSGLLVTPRSSRLDDLDDASAALISASFGARSRTGFSRNTQ